MSIGAVVHVSEASKGKTGSDNVIVYLVKDAVQSVNKMTPFCYLLGNRSPISTITGNVPFSDLPRAVIMTMQRPTYWHKVETCIPLAA